MAEVPNNGLLHVSRMEQLQINEIDLHLTHPTQSLLDYPSRQRNLKTNILKFSEH